MPTAQNKPKQLLLIGGGHTHALVIKMWAEKPLKDVKLTLISNAKDTPYSGMLPGLISGHYSHEQTHIDLAALCKWAKIEFICTSISTIDTNNKQVLTTDQHTIDYDIVSINTGSTPNIQQTPGALAYATPVKPISVFYKKWLELKQSMLQATQPLDIALVGAGAGGFELITAIEHIWRTTLSKQNTAGAAVVSHNFHWVISGQSPLNGHNKAVQKQALAICKKRQINVHLNFSVAKVSADQLLSTNNQLINIDQVLWCTRASAPQWPKDANLATDNLGFIAINNYLQSTSDPCVFAAGDVATQISHPRPKAGVFAVRQAPILFHNLRHAIVNKPLKAHIPQRQFLSLLATGDKAAIASRGVFSLSAKWLWHWKNYIDNRFMALFKDL
ncbi:FAD-dependent oxidoreductase [Gammaproteobacteria bacterium AS21]